MEHTVASLAGSWTLTSILAVLTMVFPLLGFIIVGLCGKIAKEWVRTLSYHCSKNSPQLR